MAEERMEEEVKQDTSETETQEKWNTEECEETAEASAENTETPEAVSYTHLTLPTKA